MDQAANGDLVCSVIHRSRSRILDCCDVWIVDHATSLVAWILIYHMRLDYGLYLMTRNFRETFFPLRYCNIIAEKIHFSAVLVRNQKQA